MRRTAVTLAAAGLLVSAPAVASADPAVPQPNTPCPADATDARTVPPGGDMPLTCRGGQWQAVTTPQPPSDRWLSYGPEMTLRGQGKRNPQVTSGGWTATPQSPETRCRAKQSAVVSAGVVGEPQIAQGQPGAPLAVTMLPRLFTVELSGHCLWEKAA